MPETSLETLANVKAANTAALVNNIFGRYTLTAEEQEEQDRQERLQDAAELYLDELEGY